MLRLFVIVLVIASMLVLHERYQSSRQQKLIIYAVRDHFYLDFFRGNECYSNIEHSGSERSQIFYNVLPNRKYHQITSVKNIEELKTYSEIDKNQVLVVGGKSFLAVKDYQNLRITNGNVEVDYLVLDKNTVKHLDSIKENLNFKNVILDGSIKRWEIKKVTHQISSSKNIHSVHRDGAFILSI
jgi:hypothetical protein